MDKLELNSLLANAVKVNPAKIQNIELSVRNLTIMKLRDILIGLGKIYYEDLDKQVYIVRIFGGVLKKNPAITAFQLENDVLQIAISAQEGLINQHTSEGVAYEIRKSLERYIKEK